MPSIRLLGAILSCLLAAAAAQAGTLTSATWLQVTQGVPMSRTTAQLSATGTSTASSIAVNLSYPQATVSMLVPKTGNGVFDLHVKITQGGPQAITATPGMAGVDQGVPGTVIAMLATHVTKGVNQSMFNVFGFNVVSVPINVGQAGQLTRTFVLLGQTQSLTVDFFAWTAGMVTFTGLTTKSMALPSVMAAGSFDLDGAGAGTVTLVSPTKVSIGTLLDQRRTASFTTLKLTFVPEPGTVLLLGAAAIALLLARSSSR